MRARANGRKDLVGLGRGEDEAHVLGWLFHQLQQGIEACRRNHVSLVDDVDLVARRSRREHRAFAEITSVVDTTMTSSVELDDIDGTGAIGRKIKAALAFTARIRGRALLAVQ